MAASSTDPRIQFSSELRQLYPHVENWDIHPKTRGRNEGCVLVSSSGTDTVFFKRQRLCLRTMMVYHILARIGCGPKHSLFRATVGPIGHEFVHDVATCAVPGFQMQSERTDANAKARLSPEDAVLLVLLVCSLQLHGDIPSNVDNWGTQTAMCDGMERLAIVDFSFGVPHSMSPLVTLSVPGRFLSAATKWSSQTVNHDATTRESFASVYGKWFETTEAFEMLLAGAMEDVCAWVNDDTQQRAWRRSLSLGENFALLDELQQFQNRAARSFRSFIAWWTVGNQPKEEQ